MDHPFEGPSPEEGIGYPLQYSWVSLVAQTVKNPPVMQETGVQSLSWEDPLEEGMATHFSILSWRISIDRGAWGVVKQVPRLWETGGLCNLLRWTPKTVTLSQLSLQSEARNQKTRALIIHSLSLRCHP